MNKIVTCIKQGTICHQVNAQYVMDGCELAGIGALCLKLYSNMRRKQSSSSSPTSESTIELEAHMPNQIYSTLVSRDADTEIIHIKVTFTPEATFAMFFGYIVMNGTVPDEIGKAVDDMDKNDIPEGWEMVASMWRNRNVDLDAREICDVISPWLKMAL